MARGDAYNFPVVREAIGHADALYGFKGGFDRAGLTLGVKAGGYWPHNLERGLGGNHQSTVFLFDPDTGRPDRAGRRQLPDRRPHRRRLRRLDQAPRPQGRQGPRHGRRRPPVRLPAARRRSASAPSRRSSAGTSTPRCCPASPRPPPRSASPSRPVDLDRLGAEADVIITITSSFAPILKAAQVKPGTHLACMGTDTKGKQEVEAALLAARHRLHRRGRPVGHDRRGPARRRRRPDRRDRHHPDRRRDQRRPSGPHAPPTRSPSSTAPASACRTSPSPPRVVELARAAGKAIEIEV